MCDSIQGIRPVQGVGAKNSTSPSEVTATFHNTTSGLKKALANYALWFKHEYLPGSAF